MDRVNGLAGQAYGRLRQAILSGDYAPGAALFENQLAEKLGMSRTPVREALQTLSRDGFVEIVPNRGYFIPRLSVDDVRELYELRENLEGLAARCAALRATDADIDELDHLFQQYESAAHWEAWVRLGTEFHEKLVALANNKRLAGMLDSLQAQISMTRQSALRHVKGRRDEAVREHRAILDAMRRRDPDEAERQTRAHVRLSHEATLRSLHLGQP
jgi:DNA-binding GntR family transcriptional regulator